MSSKYKDSDDDFAGEVDHDFFDSPRDAETSKSSPESPNCERRNGKNKSPPPRPPSRRTRSLSPSDDDVSDSETKSKSSVRKIEAKLPIHRTSAEYSDHFDSDSDDNSPRADVKEKTYDARKGNASKHRHTPEKSTNKREAWGVKSSPKSSKHRDNDDRTRVRNGAGPSNKSNRTYSKSYDTDDSTKTLSDYSTDISTTDSETDSDVTAVSPLHSPHSSSKGEVGPSRRKIGKPPKFPMPKDGVKKVSSRPTSAKSSQLDQLLNADSDQMDLKILMQAVLEMEKDRETRQQHQRRVLFAPPAGAKPQARSNQSFSNDRVRTIDLENQRLMQKIMRCASQAEAAKQKQKKKVKPKLQEPPKLTPSAVNRVKEQKRIEQENLAMLRRLQGTKATRDLRRDQLMTDYNHQMLAGHSIAALHAKPRRSARSPYEPRSASAFDSVSSAGGSSRAGGSRPTSAKSSVSVASSSASTSRLRQRRPGSGRPKRPEWESGW